MAIRAYLTAGDVGAAARVREQLELPLAPAELLRLHVHLPDGRDLLTRFVDERPDDPHAPKMMLTLADHYPEAANTSRVRKVYEHTGDLGLRAFLEPLLAPRRAPG